MQKEKKQREKAAENDANLTTNQYFRLKTGLIEALSYFP